MQKESSEPKQIRKDKEEKEDSCGRQQSLSQDILGRLFRDENSKLLDAAHGSEWFVFNAINQADADDIAF